MTNNAEVLMPDGAIKRQGDSLAPQGVVFSAYLSANQGPATGQRKLLLNAEEFDPFGWFDSATNYRFQPLIAGYYQISVQVRANVSTGQFYCSIYKNASTYRLFDLHPDQGAVEAPSVSGSTIVYLNGTTDYVELWASTSSSTAILGGQTVTSMQGHLVGASAGVIPEPWHVVNGTGEPAFTNAWVSFGSGNAPGFMKDPHGFVHLRGLTSSGTVGSAAFTLPAGYRPTQGVILGTISNGAVGRVDVGTIGTVTPITPSSNVWVSLDNLTFRAEQ